MSEILKIRVDKWLWAVRVFKTRTMATKACDAGKVKIEGKSVKASYQLKVGETVHARKARQKYEYKVLKLIEKRVSAALAAECFEDHSPPPPPKINLKKMDSAFIDFPAAYRERGMGRPTKKDRRDIDKLKDL